MLLILWVMMKDSLFILICLFFRMWIGLLFLFRCVVLMVWIIFRWCGRILLKMFFG